MGASLRQGWAVGQALQLIALAELERCTTLERIERFGEATGWLPVSSFADAERELVAELRGVSADVAGAMGAATREAREEGLRAQVKRLRERRTRLGQAGQALNGYAAHLQHWEALLTSAADAAAKARSDAGELPLRYAGGSVLEPGAPGFQGRADLFRTLEELLATSAYRIAPLLLGQPRTGKTSALKQLPLRLGSRVLPVFLDMERRAGANDAAGLLGDLAQEIRKAALNAPDRLSLPPLDEAILRGDPYRVFENWIEEVEQRLGEGRWLLLTLDEFNRIDEALRRPTPGGLDERIFHLIRSLIQHHPQVGVALCGTFTLNECDPRWLEALKSVQYVPVSYLRPDEARCVLSSPHPSFPPGVYSEAALERAVALTGGQPYLLQLMGLTVISAYNRGRQHLPLGSPPGTPLPVAAIEAAIPEVLSGGDVALGSIWQWLLKISPDRAAAAALLRGLACGAGVTGLADAHLRDELLELYLHRDLLAVTPDGYSFRVPLLGMWIAQQRRLPE